MNFHYDDSSMDDLEGDEELLAELLALEDADGVILKKDKVETPRRNVPITLPRQKCTSEVLEDIPEDVQLEATEEDEEMDVDDEDLLNELSELTGATSVELSPTTKREFQKPSAGGSELGQTSPLGNVSPKRPKKSMNDDTECKKNQGKIPFDPAPSVTMVLPDVPSPPVPPARTSSIALPQMVDIEQQANQKPIVAARNKDVPRSEELLENVAKNLLVRRRKLYLDRSLAAKQANDRPAAIDAFETVKMFNQALQAISEGAQLTEEDLQQIPPSPPPYKPAHVSSTNTEHQQQKVCSASDQMGKSKPIDKPKPAVSSSMSEELELVLTRQFQLKNEAIAAKKRGDLSAAKEFLSLAHRMDQMVNAAKCGFPIDVQHLPELHSNVKTLPKSAIKMETIDEETQRKCNLLERELIKQIGLCEERVSKFQSAGDSKNILLYEGLLQQSKNDLQRVQLAALGQAQIRGFKLHELSLPTIELNSSIPDNKFELKIKKIDHLRLPEGWKPSDCALYVFYKFPFPHGDHQTGRTSTIRGTNSPEFSDSFELDINRKTKQLLRICRRQPIKLEIYQKGGFLRSDKLFASADISLQELEKNATICSSFPLLEGRKKMGGNVHVEIRIRRPFGDASDTATNTNRKWVKLDG